MRLWKIKNVNYVLIPAYHGLEKLKLYQLVPAEAIIGNILFDPQRSIVIIEAEKPGIAI